MIEITRQDDQDRTQYKIGTRAFILPDFVWEKHDEAVDRLVKAYAKVVERYDACKAEKRPLNELVHAIIGESSDVVADLMNWAFELSGGDSVDSAWVKSTFTNKMALRLLGQIAKDNELEPVVELIKDRVLPFVGDVLMRRARRVADASITS